jgi:hypothetical protein
MNQDEAKAILEKELLDYRKRSYDELRSLIDHTEHFERSSPSGITYQVEVQVFLDDKAKQTVRVMAAIDDGGCRAFIPLCDDFIIAPDGSLSE